MVKFKKIISTFLATPMGVVVTALCYAAMLLAVLVFLEGESQFIYEMF